MAWLEQLDIHMSRGRNLSGDIYRRQNPSAPQDHAPAGQGVAELHDDEAAGYKGRLLSGQAQLPKILEHGV